MTLLGNKINTNLTLVENLDRRTTSTEYLRVVFVDGALGIANSRDIFDDDNEAL